MTTALTSYNTPWDTINFAPISVRGNTTVLIGRQHYDSDRLDELHRELCETHVFRRDGIDDVIIDIPVLTGQRPIGNVQEEIDLSKHHKLLPPLLSATVVLPRPSKMARTLATETGKAAS